MTITEIMKNTKDLHRVYVCFYSVRTILSYIIIYFCSAFQDDWGWKRMIYYREAQRNQIIIDYQIAR